MKVRAEESDKSLSGRKLPAKHRAVYRLHLILSPPIPAAYKHADGKKIDGRRVLVDVERGRTVKGWLPRRLGE